MRKLLSIPIAAALALATVFPAAAATDVRVSAGSPAAPFSQNKQNEPTVAIDAAHPNILVAGSNDNIDMEACNAGNDTTCPFTGGVGVSGVYFSFDSGQHWTQPTYTGWSARACLGAPGNSDPACAPSVGPIGTLPWYYENGLVSDGDPAVAFGPSPGPKGFSWNNGSRLYYANLTANFGATRSEAAFKGFEAIAVSRTDNVAAAAAASSGKAAWMPPVVISRQSSTTFSDKEQVWADNAAASPFFGNVYVCWASFLGQEKGHGTPAAPIVAVSGDGGDTWTLHQIGAAANNSQRNPVDGCTVRTDSKGTAFVFGVATLSSAGHDAFEFLSTSADGGASWSTPGAVAGPVTQPGIADPVTGRPTIDGIAGARSDLAPAPSVDIANGAPLGVDATDRLVMTYVSGEITAPHVYFTESTDRGMSWTTPRVIEAAGDRGYYTAPAISPNGTDVYVVYNAFTTPYRDTTFGSRQLVGVFLHADSPLGAGPTGSFSSLHRGTPGDPRGSSQNDLTAEFLGDYVYAAATRQYGAAVWNDSRAAADCPAMDTWRMSLRTASPGTRPAPQQDCDPTFGNSDIFGIAVTDPTP
jgi:hypothetical protein